MIAEAHRHGFVAIVTVMARRTLAALRPTLAMSTTFCPGLVPGLMTRFIPSLMARFAMARLMLTRFVLARLLRPGFPPRLAMRPLGARCALRLNFGFGLRFPLAARRARRTFAAA
ncbi:MAG: hypothetical protein IKE60_33180, partial [Reyranella sp.]|uniref:hypothetical protein n=1 Tax=Reyranella sp. TaxID=1929291 RepID=UPI0025EC1387